VRFRPIIKRISPAEREARRATRDVWSGLSGLGQDAKKQRAWILNYIANAPKNIKPALEREFNAGLLRQIIRARGAKKDELQLEYDKLVTDKFSLKTKTYFRRDWRRTLHDVDTLLNSPISKEIALPGALGWVNTALSALRLTRKIDINRLLSKIDSLRNHPNLSPQMIILAIKLQAYNERLKVKDKNLDKKIYKRYTQKTLGDRAIRLLGMPLSPDGTIHRALPRLLYEDIRDAFPNTPIAALARNKLLKLYGKS